LRGCESLTALPASLGALTCLRPLNLEGCGQLKEVPAFLMSRDSPLVLP
jgi:hypothetical protein